MQSRKVITNNCRVLNAVCLVSSEFKISRQLSKQVWGKFAETLRLALSLHGLMSQWQPLQHLPFFFYSLDDTVRMC